MPAGRRIARFNKIITNNTVGLLGPWMPGFGVVIHKGRKSGHTYRTPVNLFRRGEGYVFALTFGSGADWVKNILAAGSFEVITRPHLSARQSRTLRRRATVAGAVHRPAAAQAGQGHGVHRSRNRHSPGHTVATPRAVG